MWLHLESLEPDLWEHVSLGKIEAPGHHLWKIGKKAAFHCFFLLRHNTVNAFGILCIYNCIYNIYVFTWFCKILWEACVPFFFPLLACTSSRGQNRWGTKCGIFCCHQSGSCPAWYRDGWSLWNANTRSSWHVGAKRYSTTSKNDPRIRIPTQKNAASEIKLTCDPSMKWCLTRLNYTIQHYLLIPVKIWGMGLGWAFCSGPGLGVYKMYGPGSPEGVQNVLVQGALYKMMVHRDESQTQNP